MDDRPQNNQSPSGTKWQEEMLRRLDIQRKRVRVVRILAIVFSFSAIGGAILLSVFGASGLSPNALRFAIQEDGQALIAQNARSSLDATVWHKVGRIEGDEIVWGVERSGELRGLEVAHNGEVLAFFQSYGHRFANATAMLDGEAPLSKTLYAANAPSRAATTITEDGLATAWVSAGKLFASLGGRTPIEAQEIELELGSAPFSALYPLEDGRFQLIAMAQTISDSDTPVYNLYSLAFDIERFEVNARADAEEAAENAPAEQDSPTDGSEESPEDAPKEESEEAEEAENSSEEAVAEGEAAIEQEPMPAQPYFRASKIKVHQLASDVSFFYPLAHKKGFTLFFLPEGEEAYRVMQGQEAEWSEASEISEEMQALLGSIRQEQGSIVGVAKTSYQRPHLYGLSDGGYVRFALEAGGNEILRSEGSLEASESFKKVATISTDKSGFGIPINLLLIVMPAAFVGLIASMVWLALNRPHRVEALMRDLVNERTGRDSNKVQKPVGQPLHTLIPWAGLMRRSLAFAFDLILIIPAVYVLCALSGRDAEVALNLFPSEQVSLLDGLMERLMSLSLFGLYGFVCETLWGRTLGKRLLGMRVVTVKGQGAGMVSIFSRNMLRMIELSNPLVAVGSMFLVIFTTKHQRLGDLLAQTAVRIEMPSDDDGSLREPSDL